MGRHYFLSFNFKGRFQTIARGYYKGCHSIILVYDISDRHSFKCIEYWFRKIRDHFDRDQTAVMLVGNKADKEEDRKVTEAEGAELAKSLGMDFIETSTKLGLNIHEMFMKITEKMLLIDQVSKLPQIFCKAQFFGNLRKFGSI